MVYQGDASERPQKWNLGWDAPQFGAFHFNLRFKNSHNPIFSMKGGGYFYAPSISFLKKWE
jgi:hypothetical protein